MNAMLLFLFVFCTHSMSAKYVNAFSVNRTQDLLFTRQTQYHYAKKAFFEGLGFGAASFDPVFNLRLSLLDRVGSGMSAR